MSKEFTPQGLTANGSARTFSTHSSVTEGSLTFQIQWPELIPREITILEEKKRGELERRLLQEAEQKAHLVEKAAYEKGFAQGEKDGQEAARIEQEAARIKNEAIRQEMKKVLAALLSQKEAAFERLESEFTQLAFTLFRKILRQETPFPAAVVRETLRAAFAEVKDRQEVRVRLNPRDYEDLCAADGSTTIPGMEPWQGATMVPDPAITRGGCLLETSFGEVDARVETQFDILAGLFWEKVKNLGFPADHP